MTDRLKTVYPPKTSFCGGINMYTLTYCYCYVKVGFKGTSYPDVKLYLSGPVLHTIISCFVLCAL